MTGFILGKWPQHLWLLYVLKALVYIPAWFMEVRRRRNGGLYILDYCWVMNILLASYMLVSFIQGLFPVEEFSFVSPRVQYWAFLWFYATALGPVSWAALVLQNGLIFHSIERTASLFVHFTPLIVAWTLRWWPETVIAAWPRSFSIASLEEAPVGDIYLAGIVPYCIWWVLHASWLLTSGIHAPQKGYNTVFDGLYQKHKLGEKFKRAT